ncbi:MAG TPA: T9SS type A sorting domain-containing protein [Bacteroidia bacterium]|nr:T9SS type A sorting domain-containing protein [Bacteroidia bacterium]
MKSFINLAKTISILVLPFLIICNYSCAQFIIAGQTGSGIFYHDFIPDIELNATPSSLPGDTSTSIHLDLNQDSVDDFVVFASGGAGVSHSIWTTRIFPDSNNQVSYSHSVTVYNPCCSSFTSVAVAKVFALGDTIIGDASFTNNGYRALNYLYSMVGYGSFSINDWVQAGESYIGIRLINMIDTTYGWIRVETPTAQHIYIKDYAIGNLSVGFQENILYDQINFSNPVKEKLQIILNKNYKNLNVQLNNLLGKKTFEKEYENSNTSIEINVASFNKGIYLLKLSYEGESHIFKVLVL